MSLKAAEKKKASQQEIFKTRTGPYYVVVNRYSWHDAFLGVETYLSRL